MRAALLAYLTARLSYGAFENEKTKLF